MGQRLVLSIENNEKTVANAYYHWSGYTGPAITTLSQILNSTKGHALLKELQRASSDNQAKILAIRLLELTGARLIEEDQHAINQLVTDTPFEQATDRNQGLIQVSDEQITNADQWADMFAGIDYGTETFYADVLFTYAKATLLYPLEYEQEEIDAMPVYDVPLGDIAFDDATDYIDTMRNIIDDRHDFFKQPSGKILSIII